MVWRRKRGDGVARAQLRSDWCQRLVSRPPVAVRRHSAFRECFAFHCVHTHNTVPWHRTQGTSPLNNKLFAFTFLFVVVSNCTTLYWIVLTSFFCVCHLSYLPLCIRSPCLPLTCVRLSLFLCKSFKFLPVMWTLFDFFPSFFFWVATFLIFCNASSHFFLNRSLIFFLFCVLLIFLP